MDLHEGSTQKAGNSRLLPLTVTAIGVVYGDIGTSPLYTIRECFFGATPWRRPTKTSSASCRSSSTRS